MTTKYRNRVVLIAAVILFLPAIAFASGNCLSGDCENGKGVMSWEDGTQYTGEFKDGLPHGEGTFEYPKGKTKEIGKTKGIKYKGKPMSLNLPMGQKYTGEVKDGERHGKGTLVYRSGTKYTGEFENGVKQGQGVLITSKDLKYEGEFQKGQPNGKGQVTFPDGRIYKGEIEENQITGKGVMIYPDGRRVEGIFKEGKLKKESETEQQ